ncbi:MAG: NADH-quinone oxidoreductase subunit J [Actinomycetota bacterium]|nr:NADH-quinone oxidoreductase subunit J [Actinomycetota bacterium]
MSLLAGPLPVDHPAPGFAATTGAEVVLVLLGLLAVACALLVVTTRNVVHAALWLVVTLGALAGCYLVLAADFVAWVQVLIYVGAVVVLLLFGVMLTRAPVGVMPREELDSGNRTAALGVAVLTGGLLVALVVDAFRSSYVDLRGAPSAGAQVAGSAIFRYYVLPFEVVSVLLLAALVGAVVLSRRDVGADLDGAG